MSDMSLTNQLLLAMPQLDDPWFGHGLVYICEHTKDGAMGLVINNPVQLTLNEVFAELKLPEQRPEDEVILCGGPVAPDQGFILHSPTGKWDSSMSITEDICLTTSKDILAAIAQGQGPEKYLVTLGYAGWSAGQLEDELAENSWLTLPADNSILFDTPFEQRLQKAADQLGIDMSLLSSQAGHA